MGALMALLPHFKFHRFYSPISCLRQQVHAEFLCKALISLEASAIKKGVLSTRTAANMHSGHYVEDYETCPYDKAHRLLKHRLAKHLVTCRRNYPDEPKVTCKFNSVHVVPKAELEYHMKNCQFRNQIDTMFHTVDDDAPVFTVDTSNDPVIEGGENWDNENTPSYDPEEHCRSQPILRTMMVEPKSKRKNHVIAERKRFQEMENMGATSPPPGFSRMPRNTAPMASSVRVAEEIPEQVREQLQEPAGPPPPQQHLPLSEILKGAPRPGQPTVGVKQEEDDFIQVHRRGRGRGRRDAVP